ncbi:MULTISPECIES: EAL domain-containing protein [unclassified Methylophaga]|uniref:EAL domain-containing protein n=5 Tax=Methylophaga TaxID=40222 RepID=UPI000C98DE48|nr:MULTISPECIES: EAL domain-containing protein [unclassified Methylophaga]MAK66303.1 two-component system response regulator [Methylophaga sp.]MAY17498.1 two-component system response regulator [Methylophaga sp.]MBN47440.1 two-component system response regulator [Methylophaga sp.]HAO25384.1 two-component system response regulator [Methylophaga sp.]HCD04219.1 two-component system response regulator [Methylophaga sp.]
MARAEGILRLLIVDDSLTEADAIINVLRSAGHAVRAGREDEYDALEQCLSNQSWDLVICRDALPSLAPIEIVNLIKHLGKDLPCIVITENKAAEKELFRTGVQDVILKDDVERLKFVAERELDNLFMRRLGRRNERALRESEKRSRALLESSRDAVAYMHEGMHIYVNGAYLNLFGYEEQEDIDGLPILDLIDSEDHAKFKMVFRQFTEKVDASPAILTAQCLRNDGYAFDADIEFSHAQVEGEDCTQVVVRERSEDITEDDEQLKQLRDFDLLTGVYSRTRFVDELQHAVNQAAENQSDSALLYLVLDDFQQIKELVGLTNSDIVIKSVGEQLQKTAQEGEKLGRYGDQIFTIIVPSADESTVNQRAEAFLKSVDEFVSHANGKIIDLHCSIGIARVSENVASAQTALENADKACTLAQHAGGNQTARFEEKITQPDKEDLSAWQSMLQNALQKDLFSIHFQPIVGLHGPQQELYEVLLRLQDGEKTLLAEQFIQYAVDLQMMTEIDKWVIRTALKKLSEHRKTYPKTRFFIKLSEQTLHDKDYVDWLSVSLSAHNLTGQALIFEISETAALDNIEDTKNTIAKLKAIGCEFGLEHFGSGIGFSHSLSVLDVDYLKINGNFVENMAHDTENQAAIKSIIDMAKQAGKPCIAEFVSDAVSLALLWRLGVDYAQGFYIHKPSDKLDYNFEDEDL